MKRKITRTKDNEFCILEIELRDRNDKGLELSMNGTHGHIVTDEKARNETLEYWVSFFDENPDERRSMNERFNTDCQTPEDAAEFVLEVDGDYHGLDVVKEDDGKVFVGTAFGQIREELANFFPEATPYFKWHLNGMNAGCEHQTELGWGNGRTIALSRDDATEAQYKTMNAIQNKKIEKEKERVLTDFFKHLWHNVARAVVFLHDYSQVKATVYTANLLAEANSLDDLYRNKMNSQERRTFESAFDKYLAEHMKDIPEWKGSIFEDSLGAPCPECGYQYGTQWLHRELPDDVIEWAKTFDV
jgi:hypothetical protein